MTVKDHILHMFWCGFSSIGLFAVPVWSFLYMHLFVVGQEIDTTLMEARKTFVVSLSPLSIYQWEGIVVWICIRHKWLQLYFRYSRSNILFNIYLLMDDWTEIMKTKQGFREICENWLIINFLWGNWLNINVSGFGLSQLGSKASCAWPKSRSVTLDDTPRIPIS